MPLYGRGVNARSSQSRLHGKVTRNTRKGLRRVRSERVLPVHHRKEERLPNLGQSIPGSYETCDRISSRGKHIYENHEKDAQQSSAKRISTTSSAVKHYDPLSDTASCREVRVNHNHWARKENLRCMDYPSCALFVEGAQVPAKASESPIPQTPPANNISAELHEYFRSSKSSLNDLCFKSGTVLLPATVVHISSDPPPARERTPSRKKLNHEAVVEGTYRAPQENGASARPRSESVTVNFSEKTREGWPEHVTISFLDL